MVWCLVKYKIIFLVWYLVKPRGNFTFTIVEMQWCSTLQTVILFIGIHCISS